MTMKKTILLTTIILSSISHTAFGNDRAVNGLILGGGGGALMGQAIGRNTESTIIGATVGGILGYIIGNETRSPANGGYRPEPRYPVNENYHHHHRPQLTKKRYKKNHRPAKSHRGRTNFVRNHGTRKHFPPRGRSHVFGSSGLRKNHDRFYR